MPFSAKDGGILISVRLRPAASSNRIDGIRAMADGGRRLCGRPGDSTLVENALKALARWQRDQFGV